LFRSDRVAVLVEEAWLGLLEERIYSRISLTDVKA